MFCPFGAHDSVCFVSTHHSPIQFLQMWQLMKNEKVYGTRTLPLRHTHLIYATTDQAPPLHHCLSFAKKQQTNKKKNSLRSPHPSPLLARSPRPSFHQLLGHALARCRRQRRTWIRNETRGSSDWAWAGESLDQLSLATWDLAAFRASLNFARVGQMSIH